VLVLARAFDVLKARPQSAADEYPLVFMDVALENLTGEKEVPRWVPWVEAHRSELPEQLGGAVIGR